MTPDDPRDQAQRKFDTPGHEPLTSALDVIMRYATDPPIAIAALLDALRPHATPHARICELGIGSGWLLDEMVRVFPDARIHGFDLSRQYVGNASATLGGRIELMLGDMERLPFSDGAFDAITTNWTLYFMRDIDAALAEMRRCIAPGGVLVAATVASDHMHEFDKLVAEAVRSALGRERVADIAYRFDTTTGMPFIRRAFDTVELYEYGGEMVLPDAETAVILWPGYGPQLIDPSEDDAARAEFERLVGERIARDNAFRITRHDGVFVARV